MIHFIRFKTTTQQKYQELEAYTNEHLFVDALDDAKNQIEGPISQYRKFQVDFNLFYLEIINFNLIDILKTTKTG